ncbi:DUF2147 domain-containing protein [Bradyrhizobium septentrionale]|uniref:DUF2147 domain-containing protein n=1 Tax=Bradyrhizobium septentrionale TaxID=1404411 RepID=A0A974A2Z0_9BRAD|nr:DUF2147 domain-containing protein [Bradyrhizobium septentrionale]UGY16552.1 DUF2147 domain-containing protein [Bradyrhizobium septentrionale]UGY25209.1 DUF2147 domain-containing protein [Bradyrhizobium septentrionale]
MKTFVAIAALLMATTSAHAGGSGITFQIDGQRIHVEAPRNCSALSCIRISAPGYNGTIGNINLLGSKSNDDDDVASSDAPQPVPAAPVATVFAPSAPPPAPSTAVATAAPAPVEAAPAPAPVAAQPAPIAAAPAPTGPVGVWVTEENKGNVRVEACGANLCGYSVKTNERILINMKPNGSKWSGRIHDPDSGRDYDSTIAMQGSNAIRVQGCAFGGMFCGGQTWKRVS